MLPVSPNGGRQYASAQAYSSSAASSSAAASPRIATLDQARSHVAAQRFPDQMMAQLFKHKLAGQQENRRVDSGTVSLLNQAVNERLPSLPPLRMRAANENAGRQMAAEYLNRNITSSADLSALSDMLFGGINQNTGADEQSIRLLATGVERHHDDLNLREDNTPLSPGFTRPARPAPSSTLSANGQRALAALQANPALTATRACQQFGISNRSEKQAVSAAITTFRNPPVSSAVFNQARQTIHSRPDLSYEAITAHFGIRDMAQLTDLSLELNALRRQ